MKIFFIFLYFTFNLLIYPYLELIEKLKAVVFNENNNNNHNNNNKITTNNDINNSKGVSKIKS